jgi:pimeloyl-ACP methyl ester carboxylesterase
MKIAACAVLAVATVSGAQSALVDRTFDVAGLALHIRCGGERVPGSPLIVLEAGAGGGADVWRDVHTPITQFARACAYDRPTRGSSAQPATALAADAYVPLLAGLLTAAGEPGPYVLVGHSIGGIIAALFANRHPQDVVGMVLVDSSHEDQIARFSAVPGQPPPVAGPLPPGAEPIPVAGLFNLLAERPWRGTIPLVVLTRGRRPAAGSDPTVVARDKVWLDLQRDWTTRSPKARQVMAANSGHNIQNDEPALVVDAVRSVLQGLPAK